MKQAQYRAAKQQREDQAQEDAGRMDRAKFRRQLLQHEAQRRNARLIKRCNEKLRSGSVVMVEGLIFDPTGGPTNALWTQYTSKRENLVHPTLSRTHGHVPRHNGHYIITCSNRP